MPPKAPNLKSEPLKVCPACGTVWNTLDNLLGDPRVRLQGYQVNFAAPELGLLLFNHETPQCGTTLAVEAEYFRSLYEGPVYKENLAGTDNCPEHCLQQSNLYPCPRKCECAWAREVLQIVKNFPKRA
ncbi:MAG: hypothetical protein R6V56_04785 [Lentisphaeria bacterium]